MLCSARWPSSLLTVPWPGSQVLSTNWVEGDRALNLVLTWTLKVILRALWLVYVIALSIWRARVYFTSHCSDSFSVSPRSEDRTFHDVLRWLNAIPHLHIKHKRDWHLSWAEMFSYRESPEVLQGPLYDCIHPSGLLEQRKEVFHLTTTCCAGLQVSEQIGKVVAHGADSCLYSAFLMFLSWIWYIKSDCIV